MHTLGLPDLSTGKVNGGKLDLLSFDLHGTYFELSNIHLLRWTVDYCHSYAIGDVEGCLLQKSMCLLQLIA